MFLIDDLLLWLPLKGIMAVVEHIQEQVHGGPAGAEAGLRSQLLRLRMRYELGEIETAEYERLAAEIEARMAGLRAVDREEPEVDDADAETNADDDPEA